MELNIVDILNTGVTGFAFLMLYLGYRLTSKVQSKIFDQKPDEFKDIAMYKEWKDLVKSQLLNTRYFLSFALLFFAGGIVLLMYQAESKIILSVTPYANNYRPLVHHQSSELELNEKGRATLLVKNEHNIVVENTAMVEQLSMLKFSLEDNQKIQRKLVIVNANKETDSGF